MKMTITLILIIAAAMLLIAGCGPGQPFEVNNPNTQQPTVTQVASADLP